MKMKWSGLTLIGVFLLALPASARADGMEANLLALIRKVGVQGNMSFRHPTDTDVSRGMTFGPSVGLSPGRNNGWKFPVALSMFSEDLHGPNGNEFGTIRTRAIMAGVGYGWHFGGLSVGPQVEVGHAWNHATLRGDAPQAFGASEAPGTVSMDVSNAWIVRPEFKAEYFVTQKFTLRSSVDYVRARPDIEVVTSAGPMANRWDMSNVHFNVGVGFYPFRK